MADSDVLQNPALNQTQERGADDNKKSISLADIITGVGTIAGLGVSAAKTAGKYAYDTFAAEHNSVPLKIRLAVAGAKKAEDKLRTLRQFYPDAMPHEGDDFTFTDPQTGKRMTLNDAGASIGDMVESIPEVGEVVGSVLGGIGGGIAGTLSAGPLGTVMAGSSGMGFGAALGEQSTRKMAQDLASILTGKEAIDTRSGGEIAKDMWTTGALNSVFGLIPFGGRATRNKIVQRNLTPKSAEEAQFLVSQGMKPTLGQIGSNAGKEMAEQMNAGGIIRDELTNQSVLERNLNQFLGDDIAAMDRNAMANRFRADQKSNIASKRAKGQKAYEQDPYGSEILPANDTRGMIESIYQARGMKQNKKGQWTMPKGIKPRSDYMFDQSTEDAMERIMKGNTSADEIHAFRSDVKTLLRDKNLKHDTRQALSTLDDSLTNDLTQGSEKLVESDRAKRQAWLEYKDSQEKVKDIIGRTEGVTGATTVGQGLTEGQSLRNALNVFKSTDAGSDAEAKALAKILTPEEKKMLVSAALKENIERKGGKNSVEAATEAYNMARIRDNLVDPEQRLAFDNLIRQSKGTKSFADDALDKSGHINAEMAATGLATALNPALGATTMGVGNILRGAPGTFGGSGQFGRSMVVQNPFVQKGRQIASDIATNAAKAGEDITKLDYMPQSPLSLPISQSAAQAVGGNLGDRSESNIRIPQSVTEEALVGPGGDFRPKTIEETPFNLDDYINNDPNEEQFNLDDYINDEPVTNQNAPGSDQEIATPEELEAFMKGQSQDGNDAPVNAAPAEDPNEVATPQELEDYIEQNIRLPERLKQRESSGNYKAINQYGYSGAYQFGAQALEDVGLLKPGTSRQGNRAMDNPDNWTIAGGKETFLNSPEIQDTAVRILQDKNEERLMQASIVSGKTPQKEVNGYLAAAHLKGMGGAKALARGRVTRDANGTPTSEYYNLGRGY